MILQTACFNFAEQHLEVLAKHIKPNDHVVQVLQAVKKAGHDQVVVSNTRQSDLEWFMQATGVQAYFTKRKILGVNAHQKLGSKRDALQHYLRNKNFEAIIIIGDSKSDIDLAELAGGTTYFYKHPHIEFVKNIQADYLMSDLRKVFQEI